jgi:hypothetical protein
MANEFDMSRPLKIGEFLIALFTILLAVGGIIYNRGTMDSKNAVEINILKTEIEDVKQTSNNQYDKMSIKMDKMVDQVNSIYIIVNNKQDRK